MQLPNDEDCEGYLLGFFAAASRMRDRRRSGPGIDVDRNTNLPISANDLVPANQAVAADDLALAMTIPLGSFDDIYTPGALAKGMFQRTDGDLAGTSLAMIDSSKWDQDEVKAVREMTFRFKRAAHRLSVSGWFDLTPDGFHENEALKWDKQGLARACRITYSGLTEARRRTRGTRFELWSESILDAVNDETRRLAPEWAKAEWRQKRGFGS